MNTLNIALLSGDGIGPEIMEQAIKVVDTLAAKHKLNINYSKALVGAIAIEETGNPYPEETHKICMEADAVLFGAIGHPKYDNDPNAKVRPEQGLLAMRKKLGLFANVRPVSCYKSLIERSPLKPERIEGADFVVVRELTGGIYFGQPRGRSEDGTKAFDTCVYEVYEIERIVRYAFETAMQRDKKLCMVDKANVLATSRLWRSVSDRIAEEYPKVEYSKMFVDNAAMQLIVNPKQFDVIVTGNMFGDILTDEASVLGGSLGLLPSSSIGKHTGIFEPIHGSYPQAAGKNIANPMGMILSAAMLFDHLKMPELGKEIRQAVEDCINRGIVTEDLAKSGEKTYSTTEVGDAVAQVLSKSVLI
jgi:3-isopropylmalate dehydrogenase